MRPHNQISNLTMKIACETSGATTLGTYMIFDTRTWLSNCPLEELIKRQKIVSVDFEWQMDHFGENHFISLIQIAFKVGIAQVCLIIRTHMSRSLPKAIIDLFMNENCMKIIASPLDYNAPDFMKLWHSFELDCIHNGFVSLQHLARERGYPIGIEKLANCFDLPYESCDNHLKWADNELDPEMIRYAADDAFLNLMIYDKLLNIEIITKRLNLFWEPSICYPSYTFATEYAINTISPPSKNAHGKSFQFGTITPQKSPDNPSSKKSLDIISPTNSEINRSWPIAQINDSNRSKFTKISPISPPRSNVEKSHVKSNYPCKYLVRTGKCNKIKCEYSHSLLKCEICDITCTSNEAWDRHIKGRKHCEKNLIPKKCNQVVQKLNLRCEMCELNFDSAFESRYHFKSCKDTKIQNLKLYRAVCREKKQTKSFHL